MEEVERLSHLVRTQQVVTATLGEDAVLNCELMKPKDVLQVTWQKMTQGQNVNIGVLVSKSTNFLRGKWSLKTRVCRTALSSSEECQEETSPATKLYGPSLLITQTNNSHTTLSCSATGRPAPIVTWDDTDILENSTMANVTHPNGTVTVTITFTLAAFSLADKDTRIGCMVSLFSGGVIKNIPARTQAPFAGLPEVTDGDRISGKTTVIAAVMGSLCFIAVCCGAVALWWCKLRNKIRSNLDATPKVRLGATPADQDVWICPVSVADAVSAVIGDGEVITPSSMTAVAGLPFTLGCNVTIATGDTVKQVRWLNKHNQVLLAYEPGESVRTTSSHDGVELTSSSHRDVSAITIKRAGPNDEGCYRCIFDIYPSGAQEGKTCLSIEVKVGNEGDKTAVSGKLATMSCWYGLPDRVRQVLWRKTAEQGDTTKVASFAKRGQPSIEEPYRGRTTLSPSLGDTQLSIRPVRTEDEGCYTCEFHTYPEGTRSATACLFVYANCTAAARPAAQMVWNVEGDNRTLGPSVSSSYDQGDGTTLVTSTLLLQEGLLHDLSVKCMVHHRGLDSPMSVNLNVSCVAALLLCCLCVCLCKLRFDLEWWKTECFDEKPEF
ncbi:unnamed protein product [Coregonus sp. 'balchen']|nr:unnamed protein product [Coregonus sp. 'balchen']